MFKYVDTSKEDIERLKSARKHINWGAFFCIYFFAFLAVFGIFFAVILIFLSILFLILGIGLVLKREIYSMMIYLKEVK